MLEITTDFIARGFSEADHAIDLDDLITALAAKYFHVDQNSVTETQWCAMKRATWRYRFILSRQLLEKQRRHEALTQLEQSVIRAEARDMRLFALPYGLSPEAVGPACLAAGYKERVLHEQGAESLRS